MAINPGNLYPGKTAAPDADYPYGRARNVSTPGDGTGTPWEAALVNDLFGFQQALLEGAGIVPSGTPERVGQSQYLQSLRRLFTPAGVTTTDVGGGVDVTLSEDQTGARVLVFVGTLTANISVIVPSLERDWIVINDTGGSFSLTLRTSAGTGFVLQQGEYYGARSDGTNVVKYAGTSASRDAQTGPMDDTPGRMLTVGAGNWLQGSPLFEDDGDVAANMSTIRAFSTASETPPSVGANFVGLTLRRAGSRGVEIGHVDGSQDELKLFARPIYSSNQTGTFRELKHTGNTGDAADKTVGQAPENLYSNEDQDHTPTRSYLGNVTASYGSNATAFTAQQIESFNGNQYTAYWRVTDEVLVIAKRALPNGEWEKYEFDGAGGRDLITIGQKDVHWNCSIGIDVNGRIVICYNTRNSAILWRYSSSPEDITAWSAQQTGMTGSNENSATYPTFFYGPANELLFMYRNGVSGDGSCNINAWDPSALTWSVRSHPVITGQDTVPVTTPYWWIPPITESGTIHLFWCWREGGGVETNFNMLYARSIDGGVTWTQSDGTAYALPITQSTAEVAATIPQNSNLLNQGNAAEDENGNPAVAYHADDADGIPQLFVSRLSGGSWIKEQVTNRYVDYELTGGGARALPQARPGILVFPGNRLAVIARDYEFGAGIALYIKQDGKWVMRGPFTDNLNGYEPHWDRRRFLNEGVLDLLVVAVSDVIKEPEWNYQSPLEIWSFKSLLSIPKERVGRIETVATGIGSAGPIEVSTVEFSDTLVALAFSRPAFDKYPTVARYIVRIENSVDSGQVSAAMKFERSNQAVGVGGTVIFASRSYTPPGSGGGGSNRTVLDSGWRQLPNIDDLPNDVGFLNLQLKAASGTARVSAVTLMLGARSDGVDLPIGDIS